MPIYIQFACVIAAIILIHFIIGMLRHMSDED